MLLKLPEKNRYYTHTHHLNKLFYPFRIPTFPFIAQLKHHIWEALCDIPKQLVPTEIENNDDHDHDHKKNSTVPGTALSTLRVNPCSPRTNPLIGLNPFNFDQRGNPGTEKLNNLVKVTELTYSNAGNLAPESK